MDDAKNIRSTCRCRSVAHPADEAALDYGKNSRGAVRPEACLRAGLTRRWGGGLVLRSHGPRIRGVKSRKSSRTCANSTIRRRRKLIGVTQVLAIGIGGAIGLLRFWMSTWCIPSRRRAAFLMWNAPVNVLGIIW